MGGERLGLAIYGESGSDPLVVRLSLEHVRDEYGRRYGYDRRRKVNRSRPRAGSIPPHLFHCLRV
jgi:hypothetical protein